MRLIRFTFFIIIFFCAATTAQAAIQAELAFGPRGQVSTWELLKVTYTSDEGASAQGDLTAEVRDARGGPIVVRPLAAVGAGFSGMITLPLIATAALPRGRWPVDLTIERGGKVVEQARIDIAIETVPGSHADRILVPLADQARDDPGLAALIAGIFPSAGLAAVERCELPEEELLTAPPLLFASADVVLVTPSLEKKLTQARTSALLAAGLRLVYAGDAPPGGPLGTFVWDHPSPAATEQPPPSPMHALASSGTIWVTPALPQPRPAVIESGLLHMPALAASSEATANVKAVILLAGPGALVGLVLARGLFRWRGWVLLFAGGCFAVIALGVVAFLRGGDPDDLRQASWQVMTASRDRTLGALSSTQTLTVFAPLFARQFHLAAEDGSVMAPLAASIADYFALDNVRLSLGLPGHHSTELEAAVPAGGTLVYSAYETAIGGLIPPFPRTAEDRAHFAEVAGIDLDGGYWIDGGYVFAGNLAEDQWKEGTLFTTWASRRLPELLRPAAQVWYERRFDARRRYFLWEAGSVRGGQRLLRVIDFGPA